MMTTRKGIHWLIWVNQVRSWMVLFIFLKVTHSLFLTFHIPLSPSICLLTHFSNHFPFPFLSCLCRETSRMLSLLCHVLLSPLCIAWLLTSVATREKDPTIKTVVFSQFTKFLNIIQIHLQKRGFKFVRLDGTMNLKQRDNALDLFSEEPKFTIMLASLAVCSVGVISPYSLSLSFSGSWVILFLSLCSHFSVPRRSSLCIPSQSV